MLLAAVASAVVIAAPPARDPRGIASQTDYGFLGSASECRLVRRVDTLTGPVDCCDSCRSGMLLQSTIVQTNIHFSANSVHEMTLVSAATATGMNAGNGAESESDSARSHDWTSEEKAAAAEHQKEQPEKLLPVPADASSGDGADLQPDDDQESAISETSRDASERLVAREAPQKATLSDSPLDSRNPRRAPKVSSEADGDYDAQLFHSGIQSAAASNAAVQTDVVDTVVCNVCVSPSACLDSGKRINTWHRMCY